MKEKYQKAIEKGKTPGNLVIHDVRQLERKGDTWVYLGEELSLLEKNTPTYGRIWPQEYRQYSHATD